MLPRSATRVGFVGALVAALFAVLAVAHGAAGAQTQETERVVAFDVDITVNADGSADFVEQIAYSFGSEQRHGIERYLITAQRYDEDSDRKYPLTVTRVFSPDSPHQYTVSQQSGGRQRIRIGDPDQTITGRHNYVIEYRLDGVVNAQQGNDEFYWNVTGHEWSVPIDAVKVAVSVPGGATDVRCYAGSVQSTVPCATAEIDEAGGARFENGYLPSRQGVTVAVAIADTDGDSIEPAPILGARSTSDPFSFAEAFALTPVTVGGGALLLALFGALVARLQWSVGRDRRGVGSPTDIAFADSSSPSEPVPLRDHGATPVEFVPPDGIRPGQLGVIIDEVAHTRDVSATIIDLAVRGYMRIEEVIGKKGKVDDYQFVRLEKNGNLLQYEEQLLNSLFETGPIVLLSELKNTFASKLAKVRSQLYGDAVSMGWFSSRPDHVRLVWFGLGLLVLAIGIGFTVLLALKTGLAILGVPAIAAGLALVVGANWMPKRTALGYGVYRRALGFKDFIDNSEKHRAQWAERRHLFTEYLPYAVALGATKQWARTLDALGAPPPQQSGWYVGSGLVGWSAFGDRMDSFVSTAATTLSSTPGGSGSSGFSGGSSGGGGGGGGGGSW